MEYCEAREILTSLVQGHKPGSEDPLPPDSVVHQANVLRAMLASLRALDAAIARVRRRSQLPTNVGLIWTESEEEKLGEAFRAKEPLESIAARLGRTLRAVEARLQRMGLIAEEERATRGGFASSE